MYYVYILKSKIRRLLYIGYTDDFNKRLKQHNKGLNYSTKNNDSWLGWVVGLGVAGIGGYWLAKRKNK